MPTVINPEILQIKPGSRVYISGPMKGLTTTQYQEKFDRVAQQLRAAGFEVASPPELNRMHNMTDENSTYSDFLKSDIRELIDCQAIFMLKGWQWSNGAQFEVKAALEFAIPIFFEPGN
jgi:nucleoside 2-deoxyribosyltransferase